MKIERISENQIKCTLSGEDLSARNIRLSDLAYGSPQTRKLFREMMEEADLEVGFRSQGAPLMVEAIPTSSDSITLIITRVDDPEELDARFSRFTQPKPEMPEGMPETIHDEEDDDPVPLPVDEKNEEQSPQNRDASREEHDSDVDALNDLFQRLAEAISHSDDNAQNDTDTSSNNAPRTSDDPAKDDASSGTAHTQSGSKNFSGAPVSSEENSRGISDAGHAGTAAENAAGKKSYNKNTADGTAQNASVCGFAFPTPDSVIEAAHSPAGMYQGQNTLYREPGQHGSYLLVIHGDRKSKDFISVCSILSEYSRPVHISPIREAYLAENGEVLIRKKALAKLMNI